MSMTPDEIYAELKRIAPSASFSANTTPDHNFLWDGDGPDPADNGYEASEVEVKAVTIHQGNLLSATSHLGGHYVSEDNPDPDFSGYLPQMLQEVAETLAQELPGEDPKRAELLAVYAFLNKEMLDRYNAQRAEIKA